MCFCFILHSCCIIVSTVRWTWWDYSLILRTYLSSVLWHCWLGHLSCKIPSLIWPIVCLVGRWTLLNPIHWVKCQLYLMSLLMIINIIRDWYNYLCQWDGVLPGVCLSVCLLATSCTNYCSDLHESFTRNVSLDVEELVKLLKSFASGSESRNVSNNIPATLQDTFSTLQLISRGKLFGCSWKFYEIYLWTRKIRPS